MISFGPPLDDAITGNPQAAASNTVNPKFSPGVAFTKTPFFLAANL
jgi:hypothetical protein